MVTDSDSKYDLRPRVVTGGGHRAREQDHEHAGAKAPITAHGGRIIGLLRAAAATAVLLALLLTSMAVAQGPAPISVVSAAGRRALPVTLVNGQEYVALDDVAAFVPLSVRDDRQGGLVITVRGRNIVAPRDRALVSVDGRVVALPGPLTRAGNRWHAPVDFVPRALGPVADQRIEYRRASRLLVLGMVRVPRVTTRVETAGAGARVTIEIAPPAGVMTVSDTDRVAIRIDADALDVAPVSGTAPAVTQVRADQATLTVTLAPAAGDAKVTATTQDTAARVVIDIAPPGQAPDVSTAAPPPPPAAPPPPLAAATSGVRTVVIDPGHGGDDGGVKGPGGTLEKQVTLELAKRLKSLLEARMGVHVVLTRDDDRAGDARRADRHRQQRERPRVREPAHERLAVAGPDRPGGLLHAPRSRGRGHAARGRGAGAGAAGARRRHARHRDHPLGPGAGAAHRRVAAAGRAARERAREP